jgi:hypothetical protein
VDRLDDLLTRREALGQHLAAAALPDRFDEVARDPELDVGLEQGGADLAQHLVEVGR